MYYIIIKEENITIEKEKTTIEKENIIIGMGTENK
jgi:hypothetical protein